jgi:hypothetical protein
MRHLFVLLVLLFGILPASADGVDTRIPTSLANTPKEFWRVFMTSYYGPYDKTRKCWIATSDGQSYCMRPHSLDKSGDKLFITVAGAVSSKEGGNDCHVCNGNIGFFVLEPNGTKFALTAQSDKLLEIGVYGSAPAEEKVNLRTISSNGSIGWVVETFDFGQGINVEFYQIKGIVGDQVRTLGALPKLFSNADAECGDECTEIALEATFDTSKPDRFAPVVLRAAGSLKGAAFAKTYVAVFDETEFKYKLPDDVPEMLRQ